MGQTTEELRSTRIAEQRDDLGRDLEAIGDRVSPGRMAQRHKAAVVSVSLGEGTGDGYGW